MTGSGPPRLPSAPFADLLESRHFGLIALSGGDRGGYMEKPLSAAGFMLTGRIEIDDPGQVRTHELENVDAALDSFDRLDIMAREAIARSLNRGGAASSTLFQEWADRQADREDRVEGVRFADALTPVGVCIRVDGVRRHEERIRVEYHLPRQSEAGRLAVLFVDGYGAEVGSKLIE